MAQSRTGRHRDDTTASPLWGLTLVLADIAERLERRRTEEHAAGPVEEQNGARRDPRSRRDGAR